MDGAERTLARERLRDRVREELAGTNLVAELLAERRAAAASEDGEPPAERPQPG